MSPIAHAAWGTGWPSGAVSSSALPRAEAIGVLVAFFVLERALDASAIRVAGRIRGRVDVRRLRLGLLVDDPRARRRPWRRRRSVAGRGRPRRRDVRRRDVRFRRALLRELPPQSVLPLRLDLSELPLRVPHRVRGRRWPRRSLRGPERRLGLTTAAPCASADRRSMGTRTSWSGTDRHKATGARTTGTRPRSLGTRSHWPALDLRGRHSDSQRSILIGRPGPRSRAQ